ncbi:MAG: hypothetical protein JXB46_08905 [Candidatus Eisenbacteria bacterium]|nr:hypothetical protein [Candidatus Eisenbacteria bacterium]
MIDPRYTELMNAAIDGSCTPEEAAELDRYLESHPEAASHYNELAEVGHVLGRATDAVPPPHLHDAIMDAVAEKAARASEKAACARGKAGGRGAVTAGSRVREWFSLTPRVRYAFAFAGGLVLGIVLFTLLAVTVPQMAPAERSLLYGALGMGGGSCVVWSSPLTFDVWDVSGEARVRYCAESIVVELDVRSQSEVKVVLSYDEEAGFEGFRAPQRGDHSLRVAGHRAELAQIGSGHYEFVFSDYTESRRPLVLSVLSGDGVLFEGTLPPMRE